MSLFLSKLQDQLAELDVDPPLFEEQHYEYLLVLQKQLMQEKNRMMPQGPTPEDMHNFVILCHRNEAQQELVRFLLNNPIQQLQTEGEQT